MRFALLALALGVAACTDPSSSEIPGDASVAGVDQPTAPDTLSITAADTMLAERPMAPLLVADACPFEGCAYGTWTTSDETAVYAKPSTSAERFTVPAQTVLSADRGFVLFTQLGTAVAERDTKLYRHSQTTVPVAAGDTLVMMDSEGEGSYRVWSGGRIAFTGTDGFLASPGGSAPLRQMLQPEFQWWAHVTMGDGREGWLWMDETPPVEGADALS